MITKHKLRALAKFATSNIYKQVLKPELIEMVRDSELQMSEPKTEFEAVRNEVRRLSCIKTINKIINLIEDAEKKLDKQLRERPPA